MRKLRRSGRRIRSDIAWGVFAGLLMATFYSVVAIAIHAAKGSGAFDEAGITLGKALAAYWIGGAVGGAVLGLAIPLARNKLGAAIVGILVAIPAFVAIGV